MENETYPSWPQQTHRSDGRIVDARDVLKILGIEFMSPYGGMRGFGFHYNGTQYDDFAALVAATGEAQWFQVKGDIDQWIPGSAKARLEATELRHENGNGKVRLAGPGAPCEVISGGELGSSHLCGKMVVPGETSGRMGGWDAHQVPACGIHVAARRRVEKNDAARAEADAERQALYDRNAETNQRAREALAMLRPILAEEGIHPDTLDVKGRGVWMVPEVAETVARLLTELQEVRAL